MYILQRLRFLGSIVQPHTILTQDPNDDNYGNEDDDDGDPPRLWYPQKGYPGCAFTRSIGDEVAEAIGVYADPEIVRKVSYFTSILQYSYR